MHTWMKMVLVGLLNLSLTAGPSLAQEPAKSGAAEVQDRIQQAWERFREWEGSGAEEVPAELRRQAEGLWRLAQEVDDDSERVKAAGEALHLWVHLEDWDEVGRRVAPFEPDDDLADRIVELLVEAGDLAGDRTLLVETIRRWLPEIEDLERQLRLRLVLGDGLTADGRTEEAEAVYRALVEAHGETDAARVARGNLYELDHLGVGERVPDFSLATLDGGRVDRAQLTGRVVVIDAWASW